MYQEKLSKLFMFLLTVNPSGHPRVIRVADISRVPSPAAAEPAPVGNNLILQAGDETLRGGLTDIPYRLPEGHAGRNSSFVNAPG
jgi:hypothetical protein